MGRRNNGTYGMDISEPGFDVFTTTTEHMSFSTAWDFGAIVHQTGFVSRGQVVNFPALSFIPATLVSAIDGSNNLVVYYLFGSLSPFGGGSGNTWYQEPLVKVYTNALDFTRWAPSSGLAVNGFDFWARYIVFRLPGGA